MSGGEGWRFLAPGTERPPLDDGAPGNEVVWLDAAWQRLLVGHTPYRATEQEQFLALTAALRRLEEVFLGQQELAGYYDE